MMTNGRTWLSIGLAGAAVCCGLLLGARHLFRGREETPPQEPAAATEPGALPSPSDQTAPPSPDVPGPGNRLVPAPVPGTPAGAEPAFRLSAMTKRGDRISVGIVDRKTGHGRMLRPGESSADGWRLISVQFDQETAVFEKDGRQYTAPMERGEALVAVDLPGGASTPDGAPTAAPPTAPAETAEPQTVFSNRVYEVEGLEPVAINAIPGNLKILEIKTGGETFAMRREIVESVLRVDRLSTEDKMWMLISFPGLVEVRPGEDPVARTEASEQEMAEVLVPPTNAPPLEDLSRMVENFKNTTPPDPYPPKP